MAKRSRPKNQKKRQKGYLYLILIGVFLLAFAVFLLVSQDGGSTVGGTPKLVVEPAQINLGDVKLGTPMTFAIKVTNQGDGVLRFKKAPYIEVVEGC